MMRLFILIGMMLIFMVVIPGFLAVLLSSQNEETMDNAFIVGIFTGPIVGLVAGYLVLAAIGSKPRSSRRRVRTPRPRRVEHSRPFDARLAEFSHRDDNRRSESQPFESQMPFWMAAPLGGRTTTKPSSLIRKFLERIRLLVRQATEQRA